MIMNKISVIIPCYNEEEVLPKFYQKISETLTNMIDIDYELIFINDGSTDHTIDILKMLSIKDSHCNYYSFSRNFGKESAMYAGLTYCTGDYCVIMDADLQHPPSLLPQMYYAVSQEGYDCCAGKRVNRNGEGKVRNFLSHSFYKIIQKMSNLDMSDGAGDFRMMNRQMIQAILNIKEVNRYMKGLFSYIGFDTKWIEFDNIERVAGTSKWNFKSLFSYACEGIFSFTTAPLILASIVGVVVMLISFILFTYMITQSWLLNTSVNGYLSIICLVLFLTGIQLIFVGILGQYISKGYMESKNRPIFIIKETNREIQ